MDVKRVAGSDHAAARCTNLHCLRSEVCSSEDAMDALHLSSLARAAGGRRLSSRHMLSCEDARARGLHSSSPAPANSIACADKAKPARTTLPFQPLPATRPTWNGPRLLRQPRIIVCANSAPVSSFTCCVVRSPATRSATMTEPPKNSSVAPARRPTFARSEPIDLTSGVSRFD